MEKQKEYNLRYLLAKVRTTRGKASDRSRQRANKRNKNLSDIFQHRSETVKLYCRTRSDVGSERVNGKIEGRIEMMERQGRRREQLLDDLKEIRGHCKLEEEALDRTFWRSGFGRGCGPVGRQTT
jgi:hypothetical protein